MSPTDIAYNDQRFGVKEQFLEVIAHLLCETMNGMNNSPEVVILESFYQDCDSIRKGWRSGWATLILDSVLSTIERKQAFHIVCTNAMSHLLTMGSQISIDYLNQMETDKADPDFRWTWPLPIKTSNMVTVMFLLQEIVAGSCPCNNLELNFTGWDRNEFGYDLP